MAADLLDALGRNMDALVYIAMLVMLMVVAFHADRRFTQERNRNENLERRIRSLVLVVRFQEALLSQQTPTNQVDQAQVVDAEVLDLSVDGLISRLGYCLTCHKLRAPQHFDSTDHLRLEDDNLVADRERH